MRSLYRNKSLDIGGEDFYIDLLFFHLELRCFIIIEFNMSEFKAEYSGKMNLYVSAVDNKLSKEHDNSTLGIILCKSKNKTITEYTLRNLSTSIAVSAHQVPEQLRDSLATAEQLKIEMDTALEAIKAKGAQDGEE